MAQVFAVEDVEPALVLLELTEVAWNDCYGGVTPSGDQVDDLILLSDGTLHGLIAACQLIVSDWRDVKVAADDKRRQAG